MPPMEPVMPWRVQIKPDPDTPAKKQDGDPKPWRVQIKLEPKPEPNNKKIKQEEAKTKPKNTKIKQEEAKPKARKPPNPEAVEFVDLTGEAPEAPPPEKKNKPPPEPPRAPKEVKAKNYAAMDAGGNFGLIDDGRLDLGVRDLLAHIPRRRQAEYSFAMRPGDVLQVTSQLEHGQPRRQAPSTPMRVLFTTPARYYAPGTRVSTLRVGVAEQDWRRVFVRETGI